MKEGGLTGVRWSATTERREEVSRLHTCTWAGHNVQKMLGR